MGKPDPTKLDPQGRSLSHGRFGAYTRTLIVREYFLRHPGVPVWLLDLREAQQAADVYEDDEKIRSSINNSRANGLMNIQVVARGQCWMYIPRPTDRIRLLEDGTIVGQSKSSSDDPALKKQPDGVIETVSDAGLQLITDVTNLSTIHEHRSERLYREKMLTRSGDRILEDEDGILFRARELDLE